jgi:hypothetical protein
MKKRNTGLNSFKQIFRATRSMNKRSEIDDDIYDKWHLSNNKVNLSYVDLDEVDLPKNSDAGYFYWIGKDYCNAYREDVKEVHEFSRGIFY